MCALAVAAVLVVGLDESASARQETTDELDVVQIRPNFYVIGGAGGNIVVQIGPEGVILVDSGATAGGQGAGGDSTHYAVADSLHYQHQHGRRSYRRE